MDDPKQPHAADVIVGARIRAARIAYGMSQDALAEAIGVSFQQVQKYEKGENRISASKLVEIATALRVGAGSFLTGLGADGPDVVENISETPDGLYLLAVYSRLPSHLRRAVLGLATALAAGPGVGTSTSNVPRRRRTRSWPTA